MKYLLVLLMSVLATATSYAQEQQANPFDEASQVLVCYGQDQPVQTLVAQDENGVPTYAIMLIIDPNTQQPVGGSELAVSSLNVNASDLSLEGTLSDFDNASYVLAADRAAEDYSYVDEASNNVTVPTYMGSITLSSNGTSDVISVACVIESVK